MALVAVGAFVLLLAVTYLIARPLIAPRTEVPESEDSALEEEKERLLDSIRELDLDFATGKLADDDYRTLRARSMAEAAEAMRALAEGQPPETDSRGPAPQVVPEKAAEDEVEREIAARKDALRQRGCPSCGAIGGGADRFCRLCGAQLSAARAR